MTRAVVIAGGGTGGHLVPAAVLAQALKARGTRAVIISGDRPIEDRVLQSFAVERRVLKAQGYATASRWHRVVALAAMPFAFLRALVWLLELWPAYVILIGGYVALPVGVAAVVLRRPVYLVEPNAVPGRVTRLLAPLARKIVTLNPELVLGGKAQRIAGAPVRDGIAALRGSQDAANGYVLVLGGSQGAAALNETVPLVLAHHSLRALHVSGPDRDDAVRAAYTAAGIDATVLPYADDMASVYAGACFAVARAGAGTVAELIAAALPAVLVPYPHAADDHQRANAQVFVRMGGGRCVVEGDGFAERLDGAVRALRDDGVRRKCRAQLAAVSYLFQADALIERLEAE